ncbi:MAG: long-chain fatty acid--CoA ligase, partial [SAR324 cluster bacterium]
MATEAPRSTARTLPARTFPALLQEQCRSGGSGVAYREKEYGIWQSYTWAQVWTHVRELAEGLAALGFRRGD